MTDTKNLRRSLRCLVLGLALVAGVGLTGCQVETGGQTLPSPYYLNDDVQYHAPTAEFKLQREAAAMKAFNQQQAQQAVAQ
jgi:hypothetical protein